jgi:hypothetical protein
MEDRAEYERKRAELDKRYFDRGWMKDNVGWVIGAIATMLIIGGTYYVSGDHTGIVLAPTPETTGQGTRAPLDLAPPLAPLS